MRADYCHATACARDAPQYLDFNGVIHNCSHGAGTDINTRMGEARALLRAPRPCALRRVRRAAPPAARHGSPD